MALSFPIVRAAIIGGSGNLGRIMQRTLLNAGSEVRAVDLHRGSPDSGADFVKHDLGRDSVASLTEALRGSDVVFSMITPDVQHAPVSAFQRVNELGAANLVEACKAAGVGRLVYVSSIAATDHLNPSIEADEDTPLPPLDSYVLPYDISKRKGEETILSAHATDGLKTASVRCGGILASPTDFTCRSYFQDPGRIISVESERIDYIGAPDLCRALVTAAEKLGEEGAEAETLGGTATFVSKCRAGQAPRVHELAGAAARMLGWDFTLLPRPVFHAVRFGTAAKYNLSKLMASNEDDLPGTPPQNYMDIAMVQKTFDNTRARQVLGFEPQETWEEALENIVKEYKDGETKQ